VSSQDSEGYIGGSIATDRVSLVGRSKVKNQTKRSILVLQIGDLNSGLVLHHLNN